MGAAIPVMLLTLAAISYVRPHTSSLAGREATTSYCVLSLAGRDATASYCMLSLRKLLHKIGGVPGVSSWHLEQTHGVDPTSQTATH